MCNYLLILNGKIVRRYKSFKCALNGYEHLIITMNDGDYCELCGKLEGTIKESF